MGEQTGDLGAFADAHGLKLVPKPELPEHGGTLARTGAEAGPAAKGNSPVGLRGRSPTSTTSPPTTTAITTTTPSPWS